MMDTQVKPGCIYLAGPICDRSRVLVTKLVSGPIEVARIVPISIYLQRQLHVDEAVVGRDATGRAWLAHAYAEGPALLDVLEDFVGVISVDDLTRVQRASSQHTDSQHLHPVTRARRAHCHERLERLFYGPCWQKLYQVLDA